MLVALILWVWLRASGEGFGGFTSGTLSVAVLGAVLGYLLHLGLDASTRSGIWLLFPKGTRVGLPRRWALKTGGLAELAVAAAMVVLVLGLGLAVFGEALGGASFLLGR